MEKRPGSREDSIRWSDHKLNLMSSSVTDLREKHDKHVNLQAELHRATNESLLKQAEMQGELNNNMHELLTAWNDVKTAVRFAGALGRFGRYLASIAIFGIILKSGYEWWGE
tara:strand:- start:3370 stop:3705 length:336 start_codon:yes stop_codon:yes gene_type:complete